ncbi:DUF6551 family protein [Methylobacterium sp. 17Sr1-1]|uniref:DUF6551 family protein n=1 Tax=Methylobacterium sp. 17Sr1-1 TaxID=2202826 RepID=UPI000D6EEE9D|nr:DUF6551 family protein [Methylobacterium sp. 17Sr1-1]AWN51422.1 hypothetical protein DK412_06745 [Methylobacterium sp. 17Sr1-1]
MNRRPITALSLAEIHPGQPATSKPEVTWIKPTELLVDAAYQRDLSDPSLRLIRRIIERWDWRRFKPPIVAWTDDGLEVIDGQHSAIAAASHPGIDVIPVVVVEATARSDRAEAFVGHNRDRIAVTAAQMHVAAVAAGDPAAQSVARVAAAAGLTLLRLPPARAVYKPRETIAVAAVRGLITLEGEERAIEILRVLTEAGLGPITAAQIKAAHHLCTDSQFTDLDRAGLTQTIRATPARLVDQEAKEHAAVHCVPLWRGIAAVWFKAARKKVPRTEARSPSRAAKGGITIPAWVPDDLIEDYRDVASLEGEERATSHVRKLKRKAV